MSLRIPTRDVQAAPELIEVRIADVALEALELTLRLVHGNEPHHLYHDSQQPAPVLASAITLIQRCHDMRRQLRAYKRAVSRDLRRPLIPDDLPF
jgi:hypothetical protein